MKVDFFKKDDIRDIVRYTMEKNKYRNDIEKEEWGIAYLSDEIVEEVVSELGFFQLELGWLDATIEIVEALENLGYKYDKKSKCYARRGRNVF